MMGTFRSIWHWLSNFFEIDEEGLNAICGEPISTEAAQSTAAAYEPKGLEDHPFGEITLPELVDRHFEKNPARIWATVAKTSSLSDGFRDITMAELGRAVNAMAWHIERTVGRSDYFETIAFQGASDVRYAIFWLAAVKCGYKLLVPSVRNSVVGNVSLMEETQCGKFFYSIEMTNRVKELQGAIPSLVTHQVSSLDEMLTTESEHYPYQKVWDQAKDEPVIICHTSGSTGSYKPIVLDHMYFAIYDNQRKLAKIPGRQNLSYANFDAAFSKDFVPDGTERRRFYSAFPPFHVAGIVSIVAVPIYFNATLAYGPADQPASGPLAMQMFKSLPDIRAVFTPPTILEEFMQEPDAMEQAAHLDFALFAGGPLAPSCGDKLIEVTPVYQFTGSTECGIYPALAPEPRSNWNYFEWHPVYECAMQPVSEEIFELVIPREEGERLQWIRGRCFPDRKRPEWRTKDTFTRHPDPKHRDCWKFHGRTDDIVVLSNGEKFNPVTQEGIIQGHSLLSGALVIGQARTQASLLVELRRGISLKEDEIIDQIWPVIEKANNVAPAHARIFRSKVIITRPDRPFERVGKGTVKRQETLKAYAFEIEALYGGPSSSTSNGTLPVLEDLGDEATVAAFLRQYLQQALGLTVNSDDDDFFDAGVDSVQTIELASGLKGALKEHIDQDSLAFTITPKIVYAHPTVARLAQYLYNMTNKADGDDFEHVAGASSRAQRMKTLVDKHTNDMPLVASANRLPDETRKTGVTIILTGTTGTLGIWMLHTLLSCPQVVGVYCLDRSPDAQQRNIKAFRERHLPSAILSDKRRCVFIQAAFGSHQLGLDDETYAGLLQHVDAIVHNAWAVNFNHSLESFDAVHIRGVRRFIDFAALSPRKPRIHFVSSISSVGNWGALYGKWQQIPAKGLVAAKVEYDVAQLDLGYGESKHVSERVLELAVHRNIVSSSILRVGQIAGPLTPDGGCWTKHEWLPSLVKTTKVLGQVPQELGTVDWIPVDELAAIIRDLVLKKDPQPFEAYNLVNPRTSTWAELVPEIQKYYEAPGSPLKPVNLGDWIKALEKIDINNSDAVSEMPSIKILDFYRAIDDGLRAAADAPKNPAVFDTANATSASITMRRLRPIDKGAMRTWLNQWAY